jgi:UDP-sugar transporter A1/2/3
MVTSQLKFATTALCFSIMLNRVIGLRRWISLGVLAGGVILVQISGQMSTLKPIAAASERNVFIGMASIIAACFISGFASIYLERILKDASNNLWATNIHLGVFSLLPATLPCIIDAITNGFYHPFAYFGFWAWTTVWANVLGGLVVALIMKYADNIQKSLAISASIVFTFIITVAIGKAEAAPMAVIGSALVIMSIVAYSQYPAKEPAPEQQKHAERSELDQPLLSKVTIVDKAAKTSTS